MAGLVLVTLGFIGLSQASDYRVLLALMVMAMTKIAGSR